MTSSHNVGLICVLPELCMVEGLVTRFFDAACT
jgi:hypothetical protein